MLYRNASPEFGGLTHHSVKQNIPLLLPSKVSYPPDIHLKLRDEATLVLAF